MELPILLHHNTQSPIDTPLKKPHSTEIGKTSEQLKTKSIKRPKLVKKLFENANLAPGIFNGGMKVLLKLEFFENLKLLLDFLSKNPLITLSFCAFLLLLGIPLFVFITLAFVSSTVTFIGFAILEGRIIIMGSIIVGGMLLVIFEIVIMTTILISIISFGLQKMCNLK